MTMKRREFPRLCATRAGHTLSVMESPRLHYIAWLRYGRFTTRVHGLPVSLRLKGTEKVETQVTQNKTMFRASIVEILV